jgi:hypothetical protein
LVVLLTGVVAVNLLVAANVSVVVKVVVDSELG